MKARLLVTMYEEKNRGRASELRACLEMNEGSFDEIHTLAENDLGRRQHYSDVLALAADVAPYDLTVVANTDIMISRCVVQAMCEHILHNEAWCLTRWDFTTGGMQLFDRCHSQDVWAFKGPSPAVGADFPFGFPGVDNRLAHELDAAGYKVLNPSKSIQTYHLHLSGHRPGNKPENRVPGPYLFVSPHKLGEKPKYTRPKRISMGASQFQESP